MKDMRKKVQVKYHSTIRETMIDKEDNTFEKAHKEKKNLKMTTNKE